MLHSTTILFEQRRQGHPRRHDVEPLGAAASELGAAIPDCV
jgi:hypothetical protein